MTKTPMNMRLSEEARTLMKRLGQKLGLDETSVVEMAVRKLAEAEGVRTHEDQFQQLVAKILGECYKQPGSDFEISDGKTVWLCSTKPYKEGDVFIHSCICNGLGETKRHLEQAQAEKTPKYFFSIHSSEGSRAEENKETHEVKK